jgi:hypothetical protein
MPAARYLPSMQTNGRKQPSFNLFRLQNSAFRELASMYIRGMVEQLPAMKWV